MFIILHCFCRLRIWEQPGWVVHSLVSHEVVVRILARAVVI